MSRWPKIWWCLALSRDSEPAGSAYRRGTGQMRRPRVHFLHAHRHGRNCSMILPGHLEPRLIDQDGALYRYITAWVVHDLRQTTCTGFVQYRLAHSHLSRGWGHLTQHLSSKSVEFPLHHALVHLQLTWPLVTISTSGALALCSTQGCPGDRLQSPAANYSAWQAWASAKRWWMTPIMLLWSISCRWTPWDSARSRQRYRGPSWCMSRWSGLSPSQHSESLAGTLDLATPGIHQGCRQMIRPLMGITILP